MNLSYIKKIIKLVENSAIDELELEEEGTKIKVARNRNSGIFVQPASIAPQTNQSHSVQNAGQGPACPHRQTTLRPARHGPGTERAEQPGAGWHMRRRARPGCTYRWQCLWKVDRW